MPPRRSLRAGLALLLTVLVTAVLGGPAAGPGAAVPATGGQLFTPVADPTLGAAARVHPDDFRAYRVDLTGLDARLSAAPTTRAVRAGAAPLTVTLPDPAGEPAEFRVQATSVMEPGLASRHPELRTWAGTGVTDPTATVRLDLTPMGFHASVLGAGGAWYVDPAANRRGTTTHLVYDVSALPAPEQPLREPEEIAGTTSVGERSSARRAAQRTAPGAEVQRRTYRLALVTDPSYASYFGSANVLAEKVTLVNRVDQVYNDDLAIRLLLVDGTEDLNLDTAAKATLPGGPCGANACYPASTLAGGCSGTLLDRTGFVLGQIIGADAYDVGHIALGIDGGGLAGLGVVGTSTKASGCTGLPTPEGDFFAVDYVAHEIGHQFGGNHTFDGTNANCSGGNRNAGTSVEPGSGSSVMAYAGICGRDDLQPHSDPYFSQRSIDEITATVEATPSSYAEQQVVNLQGYDTAGESFQLTYPGADPVTITRGAFGNYSSLGIGAAVMQLTGQTAVVSGYDGAANPGQAGFTLDFSLGAGVDLDRLGVVGQGDVTGFVGVLVDGGPGTNRGVTDATGNHAPSVTAPPDRTIPVRTPFALTAAGSDVDGGGLTYLWEQNDEGRPFAGGYALLTNDRASGPLFRVFGEAAQVTDEGTLQSPSPGLNLAGSDPTRTFPDLAQVLAGTTNAATGACPAPPPTGDPVPQDVVDCYSEYLPTAAYGGLAGGELNFRVTARDGFAAGGGTAYDDVTLSVDDTAGPLLVTSYGAPGGTAEAGAVHTVTWDVNGTDAAGLAPQVQIRLSTDGGQTWPTVLDDETPNDGAADVLLPDLETTTARLRVDAVDNYFFDVSDADFTITHTPDTTPPDTTITSAPKDGSFVLSRRFDVGFTSTEAGDGAVCTLDDVPLPCGAGTARVNDFATGPHVLRVAARDLSGNVDPTPAVRRFVAPLHAEDLKRSRGWKRVENTRAYRGAFLVAQHRGKTLATTVAGVTRVALVVTRAPGSGKVAVLLDGARIATVDLAAPSQRRRQLVTVRTFAVAKSGTWTIRTLSRDPVRIEGLGLK